MGEHQQYKMNLYQLVVAGTKVTTAQAFGIAVRLCSVVENVHAQGKILGRFDVRNIYMSSADRSLVIRNTPYFSVLLPSPAPGEADIATQAAAKEAALRGEIISILGVLIVTGDATPTPWVFQEVYDSFMPSPDSAVVVTSAVASGSGILPAGNPPTTVSTPVISVTALRLALKGRFLMSELDDLGIDF